MSSAPESVNFRRPLKSPHALDYSQSFAFLHPLIASLKTRSSNTGSLVLSHFLTSFHGIPPLFTSVAILSFSSCSPVLLIIAGFRTEMKNHSNDHLFRYSKGSVLAERFILFCTLAQNLTISHRSQILNALRKTFHCFVRSHSLKKK